MNNRCLPLNQFYSLQTVCKSKNDLPICNPVYLCAMTRLYKRYTFICSLVRSFVRSLVHSFIRLFVHSFMHACITCITYITYITYARTRTRARILTSTRTRTPTHACVRAFMHVLHIHRHIGGVLLMFLV